MANTLLGV